MAIFEVNGKTCSLCGLCVADCVFSIIEIGDLPFIAPENQGKCIHCGHCQAICPTASITLDGIDPRNLASVEEAVPAAVIKNIVKNRRSVRQFSSDPVDTAMLKEVIGIAAWTPTAINIRDIGFIIFNGRQKVEKLMFACADVMEKCQISPELAHAIRNGQDVIFRNAPCLLVIYASERAYASTDCATTLAAIELALPSFGLASCWAGIFTNSCAKELPAGLVLPEGKRVFGGLMIGKPAIHYSRIPERPLPRVDWV